MKLVRMALAEVVHILADCVTALFVGREPDQSFLSHRHLISLAADLAPIDPAAVMPKLTRVPPGWWRLAYRAHERPRLLCRLTT